MKKKVATKDKKYVLDTAFGKCGITLRGNKLVEVILAGTYPGGMFTGIGVETLKRTERAAVIARRIKAYFDGKKVKFDDIDVELPFGSEFSSKVLQACRQIPYGSVVSYKELAAAAGFEGNARPVGNVLARNPVPLVIPCHRVIRTDGKIGGFVRNIEGATEVKRRMLALEAK